jgi:hypothetical protein
LSGAGALLPPLESRERLERCAFVGRVNVISAAVRTGQFESRHYLSLTFLIDTPLTVADCPTFNAGAAGASKRWPAPRSFLNVRRSLQSSFRFRAGASQ